MFTYLTKRVFGFIPTLFIVTLIGFFLLANSSADPIETLIKNDTHHSSTTNSIELQKKYWEEKLGLNLPLFYFSIKALAEPDTLYKIRDKQKLKFYTSLLNQTGNSKTIDTYLKKIVILKATFFNFEKLSFQDSSLNAKIKHIIISIDALEQQAGYNLQQYHIKKISTEIIYFSSNEKQKFIDVAESLSKLYSEKTIYKNYIPKLTWYGKNNQYHQWLFGNTYSKGIMQGDFGISYTKKEPVLFILKDKLIWSLFFSITSLLLSYFISIYIGIKMAEKPQHSISKVTQIILFALYSVPPFFLGVLLLMTFANPDVLSILPPSGIKPIDGYSNEESLIGNFIESLPYMILPLICYSYSSVAFISKLTTTSLTKELTLDYIRTARAKGLSDKKLIWKHALKNSALPLITVFSSLFPNIIGGSFIIESIFTIPGMGLETIHAIKNNDYPIVIAVITLTTLLTMISYLVSDVLYTYADARLKK